MARKNKYATMRDLVRLVKKNTKYDEALVREVIDLYFEEIKDAVISNKQVRLSGFGVFSLKKWKSNTYFDPNSKTRTSKQIQTVSFKPSKILRKKVKDS